MFTMKTYYFKDWQGCLAESDFKDNLKTAYRYTIVAFLAFLKERGELATLDNAKLFIHTKMGRERPEEWKVQRWKDALNWFFRYAPVRRQVEAGNRKPEATAKSEDSDQPSPGPSQSEADQTGEVYEDGRRRHSVTVREYQGSVGPEPMIEATVRLMRVRHMSYRTEEAYIGWLRRFARFHEDKRMDLLGEEEKYTNASTSWEWFWVFPSRELSTDPRDRSSGKRRHHILPGVYQRHLTRAAKAAGIGRVKDFVSRDNSNLRTT